jgi:thiol-disulfide isomerase/thioredoxin
MTVRPSKRVVSILAVVALLTGAFALARAAFDWRPTPSTQRGGAIERAAAGDATGLSMYAGAARRPAPPVEGTTLDGRHLALADLTGHVVVINVWGSWCVPCRAEAPILARLARETVAKGVRFVGIDTRDRSAAARAFVRNFKIPYPSILDTDGQVLLRFSGVIPVSAIPSTLVVDRAGRIAARVIGRVDYTTLRGLITDEIAGKTPLPATTPAGSP